jgi:isocitrate/isopropylmalate dehydrogenase
VAGISEQFSPPHGVSPGDGIGQEVIPPVTAVLDAIGRGHGITFAYDEFNWSYEAMGTKSR